MAKRFYDKKTIHGGAWITLILALASIPSLALGEWSFIISPICSILSLISGFYSLRIIHQNEKYFKGKTIIIVSIIFSILMLVIISLIGALFVLLTFYDEQTVPLQIDNIENAINFTEDYYGKNISNAKVDVITGVDAKNLISNSEFNETEFNSTLIYNIIWEEKINTITKKCNALLTMNAKFIEYPSCRTI